MESRKLYSLYEIEKKSTRAESSFDMITRIEDYRRNIDLYNSFGLTSSKSISSAKTIVGSG